MFFKEKAMILIADDTEANIDVLVEALGDTYDLAIALNGNEALEAVNYEIPDLILLDILMPGMNGYEVCEKLKKDERTEDIPVIFLTGLTDVDSKTKSFELGAVDYITKPFEVLEVQARVKTHLELKSAQDYLANQNQILEARVDQRTDELQKTKAAMIFSLAALAETRDPETGEHIKRTQWYVKVLAENLSHFEKYASYLRPKLIDMLFEASALHDIGKVGVRDSVLLKAGKLTTEEFEEMKNHTLYGRNTLDVAIREIGNSDLLSLAKEIAYTHHERWDGKGYPVGLERGEIPISGRIMALADVYDALVSKRVYKEAYSHEKSREIILRGRGTQFDPDVVDAFLLNEEFFKEIVEKYKDKV